MNQDEQRGAMTALALVGLVIVVGGRSLWSAWGRAMQQPKKKRRGR